MADLSTVAVRSRKSGRSQCATDERDRFTEDLQIQPLFLAHEHTARDFSDGPIEHQFATARLPFWVIR